MKTRRYRRLALGIFSLLALALVVALVWAMVLGERRSRQLSLQFEVYRASANIVEAWFNDPTTSLIEGPILGFGVYGREGQALVHEGSAPLRLATQAGAAVTIETGRGSRSLILARPLPGSGMGMGGPGRGEGGRPLGGMMGGFANPPLFAPPGIDRRGSPNFAGPRTLWLEYAIAGESSGRLFLVAGGILLTSIFLALYILLWSLLRKNSALREREGRNRELAELGEAARNLVHEIKNPLGIIGIQAATLRKREGDETPAGRAALIIDGEVGRLARMADRIREFLKSGAGEATQVDLVDFLEEFSRRYAVEPPQAGSDGPRLCLALDERQRGKAWASIDRDRLSLALDNLVRNAYEANPAGSIEVTLARRGRLLEIQIADRGPGVSASVVSRFFEPFFTTKERGSGIGLALARNIARGAEGDLDYQPRPGGGAIFILSLPAR